MPRKIRTAARLVTLVLCCSLFLVPVARSASIDGLSDQNFGSGNWPSDFQSFVDNAWVGPSASGPAKIARYVTAWNLADNPSSSCYSRFRTWYDHAKSLGMKVEVALWTYRNVYGAGDPTSPGYCPRTGDTIPDSAATYSARLGSLLNAFPGIDYVDAFNEPNATAGSPSPAAAAGYYVAAASQCASHSCTAIAGNFVDAGSWLTYMQDYKTALGSTNPANWGVHPYGAVKNHTYADIASYKIRIGDGNALWFTEVGASRCDKGGTDRGDAQQNSDAAYLVNNLIPVIKPVHTDYYGMHWIDTASAPCNAGYTDYGLYDVNGVARSAARTIYGADRVPAVTTGDSSDLGAYTAKLSGSIVPGGIGNASYHFDFGTTASYGTSTETISAGAGLSSVPVSLRLNLPYSGTTYHYRLVASNGSGTTYGGDRTFTTSETPVWMTVTSNNIGYIQNQPWTSTGWGAFINWPSDLKFATGGNGTTWALAKDDPDQDNQGTAYFQTTPFTPTWYPIAPLLAQMAITTPVGGGAMVTGVSAQDGVLYQMDSPFTASGWHAISPATDRVDATAPIEGGSQIVERDVRAPHVGYYQNSPYTPSGWTAIANSVDEIVATSPRTGGTVVAITDENTHIAYFQTSPYTPSGWHALANDVKHIYLTRAGNGQARVGIITNDGKAYVQTYPFSASGWQQISPAGWNIRKLAMSGDSLGIIHDEGGSPIAAFTQEPFPATFTAGDWHAVSQPATDIGFDQRGF